MCLCDDSTIKIEPPVASVAAALTSLAGCLCALADLNDELNTEWMPDLEKHYQWTAETDPDHPTWAVLYEAPQLRQYLRTFDVVGTDPCAPRAATLKRKALFRSHGLDGWPREC